MIYKFALSMDFGPNSDFVPHSPLSYSNSYAPVSPIKIPEKSCAAQQNVNQLRFDDCLQNEIIQNKSILKNSSSSKYLAGTSRLTQSNEKKQVVVAPPSLTRKGSLKTVAFGLTTSVDETVLGKDAKNTSNNNRAKTVIFSHEAQSLHKLITARDEEVEELKRSVNELKSADKQHQIDKRDLLTMIDKLSKRLIEVENRLAGSRRKLFSKEEKGEKNDQIINIEKENQENNKEEEKQNDELVKEIIVAMQNDPKFKERMRTSLRIWVMEGSSSPAPRLPAPNFNQNREEEENSAIPSEMHMFRRTITQQEEVRFISASPSRYNNRNRQPMGGGAYSNRKNHARTKPIIEHLDDSAEEEAQVQVEDDYEEKRVETMPPNIRRSEHCTDDADFFQNEDEEEADINDQNNENGFGRTQQRNMHEDGHAKRRRNREANSAIRNRYK